MLADSAVPLAACVQQISSVDKTTEIDILGKNMDKTNKTWLPWQRPLSHTSTKPENLAKIGAIDTETVGVTEIVKNE